MTNTTERRVKDLESKIAPNKEKCLIVVGLVRDKPPKCPRGITISPDLRECGACPVPVQNRDVHRVRWMTAEDVEQAREMARLG